MRPYFIAAAFAAVFCQAGFGQSAAATSTGATKRVPQAPAATAAPAVLTQPDSTDWRFAFPGSPVLASFNLGRILRLPAVTEALKNVPAASQAQMNMGLKMIEGIEKIQVSIRPAPANRVAGAKTSGNKVEDPEVLILVTGELGPMLHLILEQQGGPQGVGYRQIAPNVLLLGKNGPLEQAARRMASAPAPGALSGTASGVGDSLSASDIWIGGDTSLMAALGQTTPPPGLDTLKRFSVGVNLGDPFELNVHLLSANEAGSDKILGLYSLAMAAAGPVPPEFASLVERIKVDKQGSEVRVHFSAPVAMLQAAAANSQALKNAGGAAGLSPALAGFLGGGATADPGTPSAAPAPAAPPAPKKPGKIKIYGLDDGPREIVVPARN